jgi:ATP-dependent Clp protease ATP-binding subunit ClpB
LNEHQFCRVGRLFLEDINNLEKFTQESREALLAAQHLVRDFQHQVVEPIYLLLALIQQHAGIVRAIITKVSGGTQAIQEELSNELGSRP